MLGAEIAAWEALQEMEMFDFQAGQEGGLIDTQCSSHVVAEHERVTGTVAMVANMMDTTKSKVEKSRVVERSCSRDEKETPTTIVARSTTGS